MQLNEILAQVDALKGEIERLRPLKPEVEHRIMQKFRLDWNYHSNAIEGNSLTLGETRAFLLEGLTANGKPLKDHLDIKGHNELITFLELFIQRKERLTEAAIREMHKILLIESYEVDAITMDGGIVKKRVKLGEYKTEANCVRTGSGEIYQYASPQEVAPKMAELVAWNDEQNTKTDLHPVMLAAIFHHRFLAIHPFDDGNGRLARVLMNLMLMRFGYPPLVIKIQERDPYISSLRRADAGETGGIVSFIGNGLIYAEKLFIRGANGESIEEADDLDKEIALLKQELAHVDITLPLNSEVFKDCLNSSVVPLVNTFELKLQQFDDLFNGNQVIVSVSHWKGTRDGNHVLEHENSLGRRNTAADTLLRLCQPFKQIQEANLYFSWNKFTKAHLNAFDMTLGINFTFEELQLLVRDTTKDTTLLAKRYPHNLTVEEMSFVVRHFVKSALETIRTNSKPKN